MSERREGEQQLKIDPATLKGDGHIVFIGRISTPWKTRAECPKNGRQSNEICYVDVSAPYRDGLTSIETCTHVFVLYWMHQARRDLIVQAPSVSSGLRGCFAIRSPVRPNPVSLSVVDLISVDHDAGRLKVRGLDCLDGTPLVDIKPYFSRTDSHGDANVQWESGSGPQPTDR